MSGAPFPRHEWGVIHHVGVANGPLAVRSADRPLLVDIARVLAEQPFGGRPESGADQAVKGDLVLGSPMGEVIATGLVNPWLMPEEHAARWVTSVTVEREPSAPGAVSSRVSTPDAYVHDPAAIVEFVASAVTCQAIWDAHAYDPANCRGCNRRDEFNHAGFLVWSHYAAIRAGVETQVELCGVRPHEPRGYLLGRSFNEYYPQLLSLAAAAHGGCSSCAGELSLFRETLAPDAHQLVDAWIDALAGSWYRMAVHDGRACRAVSRATEALKRAG